MLNQDDFLADHEYDSDLLGDEHDYHCAYAVEMAKLAVISEFHLEGSKHPLFLMNLTLLKSHLSGQITLSWICSAWVHIVRYFPGS